LIFRVWFRSKCEGAYRRTHNQNKMKNDTDDDELDWLCLVMGGLVFEETKTKALKYPEIDVSYAFRPHTRQPKLIRAIVEQQPSDRRPTAHEPDDFDIHMKLCGHLQELEMMYAFHATSKIVINPPPINAEEIKKNAAFKSIRASIHKAWFGNTHFTDQKHMEMCDTKHWNHEDAIAETKKSIENWIYVREK
jgi:hypothetical protein